MDLHEPADENKGRGREKTHEGEKGEPTENPLTLVKPKSKKITNAERYANVAAAIDGVMGGMMPPFKKRYIVFKDMLGIRKQCEVDANKVVHDISLQKVADDILIYLNSTASGVHYTFEPRHAMEAAKFWRSTTKITQEEDIKPIAQLSYAGLCWHRLPWDVKEMPTPLFDEILSRASHPKQLQAFIGSLLIYESDRQQYMHLSGEGENSKGGLLRFKRKLTGRAYRAEDVSKTRSQFWASNLMGARLVGFAELDDPRFMTSGFFKTLTGGDSIRMERKNEAAFTGELICKFVFNSNYPPEISSNKADMRRLLSCKFLPLPAGKRIPEHQFDAMLWAEGPGIVFKCLQTYRELCPAHEPIPMPEEDLLELASEAEEEFECLAEKYFDTYAWDKIDPEDYKALDFVSPGGMMFLFKQEKIWDKKKQGKFIAYLERQHGVKRKRFNYRDKNNQRQKERRYLGIKFNDETLANFEVAVREYDRKS
jgi:hypothetical protein